MQININKYRPVPFYFINTIEPQALNHNAIFKAVEKLKDNGFGGCVVFNKPPSGFSREEYLSDKWFEMIKNFAEAGRKLQMQIWINDGFDFPPGDAGGRIQKINPALKQKMLKAKGKNEVEIIELDWGFPAFEEPESSELFVKLVYGEYYKRLGEYFGNGITGFFSDTDCRRINAHVLDKLDGKPYYPWSANFEAEFKHRFGYDIIPHLSALVREKCTGQIRRDYWNLAGELYCRWFRSNHNWCHEHGVLYSFHSSDTGPFSLEKCQRSSIFAEGSFLKQAQFCDYPGTDHELLALDGGTHYDSRYYIASAFWGGNDSKTKTKDFNITQWDLRAKYAASAAYLYNRKRTLCEAFAATNWGANHQDLRRIASWQIMQGINFFVPHAVHHCFQGETKYFAPPEFMSGSLRYGLKEFNNFLARMCFIASQGKLIEPVAVLDPTESVWHGKSHHLFELCDQLNRMPINYIITDETALRKNPGRFKYLILPGISPAPPLPETGCRILNMDELDKLPIPDISFSGGDIHYMLRRLKDGTEILLAANIWSDTPLEGTLRFKGKSYDIKLSPGEISVFNGPFENYRLKNKNISKLKLPEIMRVKWHDNNIIPLPLAGKFSYINSENISDLHILHHPEVQIYFDGQKTSAGSNCSFLGDNYSKTSLPHSGNIGSHTVKIKCPAGKIGNAVYLCGEFNVDIKTENEFHSEFRDYYNIKLYMPEKIEITLSNRSKYLHLKSWAEQGAPFYSGEVTYYAEIFHEDGQVLLDLGRINGVCTLKLNDQIPVKKIWEPYEFLLDLQSGINHVEITVSNTFANLLECYKAESGIVDD